MKNSILHRIAETKKQEILKAKKIKSLSDLLDGPQHEKRDFIKALAIQPEIAIIAEIKRASPSKGLLRQDFDVAKIAEIYEAHGARCLSVLTDVSFFQGHPDFLALAKSHCNLPVLRKDFIIDSYQIYESLSLQADCILLIAALLDNYQLQDFCQIAQELGLAVLVESHTREEVERAIKLPTPLIGINNRSLHDFSTNLQTTISLSRLVPQDKLIISESGIEDFKDITCLRDQGVTIFLIGEGLMREKDIGLKLDQFLGLNKTFES